MRNQEKIIIEGKTLKEHLRLHKLWLKNETNGVRLDLQFANLQGADLQGADLQGADLQDADLRGANLRNVNLRNVNLQGANLDFSQLNLSCDGLNFKIDDKQAKQLMYHVVSLMQYSNLDVDEVIKKHAYKWLEDSHLVTGHGLKKLK